MPRSDSNPDNEWQDVGMADGFQEAEVREVKLGSRKIAVSFKNGTFGVVSAICNHAAGPLAQGPLDGDRNHGRTLWLNLI